MRLEQAQPPTGRHLTSADNSPKMLDQIVVRHALIAPDGAVLGSPFAGNGSAVLQRAHAERRHTAGRSARRALTAGLGIYWLPSCSDSTLSDSAPVGGRA